MKLKFKSILLISTSYYSQKTGVKQIHLPKKKYIFIVT